MGWPLVGDGIYGARDGAETLHLLARGVAVPLYANKPAVAVAAPVPPHMRPALDALGFAAEPAPAPA